jgi:hypothetical protein
MGDSYQKMAAIVDACGKLTRRLDAVAGSRQDAGSAKRYTTRQAQMFGDPDKQSPFPDKTTSELYRLLDKTEDRGKSKAIEAEIRERETYYRKHMGRD